MSHIALLNVLVISLANAKRAQFEHLRNVALFDVFHCVSVLNSVYTVVLDI